MTTYNREFKWNPPRRKKQRYALIERVVDFSKAPLTVSTTETKTENTTAWAAGDILEAIAIRAGQTVLGVEFELLTRSSTANAYVEVGYGSDSDYWGRYMIGNVPSEAPEEVASSRRYGEHADQIRNFGSPLYFSSADTIDLKINKAITTGRVRLIVHILEDDR